MKNNLIKIAIASGKGGTGKTLIATNLFEVLKNSNYKVNLVDCDAEEPNSMIFFQTKTSESFSVKQNIPLIDDSKCVFCGKCSEYCNYNAIFIIPPSRVIKVLEDLCHGCGACFVACENKAITKKIVFLGKVTKFKYSENASIIEAKMKVGVYSPVPVIKEAINEAENAEIVIMDSPPGTSCPFIQTVVKADYVILVTEPTPFGLSDLKQSIETLKTLNKPFGVIINRAGLGDNEVYNYLNKEKYTLLLEIPYDKEIAMHYSKGELFSSFKKTWQTQLKLMFNQIIEKYGNSNH